MKILLFFFILLIQLTGISLSFKAVITYIIVMHRDRTDTIIVSTSDDQVQSMTTNMSRVMNILRKPILMKNLRKTHNVGVFWVVNMNIKVP